MKAADLSSRFFKNLQNAASRCAVYGDPQALVDIISQVQKESYNEGYGHAVEALHEEAKRIRGATR